MQSIRPLLHGAEYVSSVHHARELPPDEGLEVAIAGRSNAGKSSLINRLCRRKALARTSRTPGRTQQIVLFRLDDERRLVDLPGYGYANVSRQLRQHWQKLIGGYMAARAALAGLVIVMDIRHPLREGDQQLVDFAVHRDLPLHLVLTKADKLGRGKQIDACRAVQRAVGPGIEVQAFSAEDGSGVDRLEARLAEWFDCNPGRRED
ncbi:MAG: ribosome biogenesis GTP-binding protein YihA/YsxC [Wenzhouxiangellaceae bacterium]|nr:ribosome biogenesis GTP-binding protein YihA/YsxC [Wenzhouxiangellaceae bacterium]